MGFKSACLSVTVLLFIAFVFISIISDDIQGIEGKGDETEIKVGKESKSSKAATKKREASAFMDDFGNNEVNIGGKRFKLYEKKHLNHKKAASFCKKKDGKLAEAMNLEEMRRLQMLLLRARSISDDIWVGADKKEWKKHSLKMQRRPNFGPDPMLFGGGPTEMCPALSVSTRSLSPVMCNRELPFICESDPNQKPKPTQGKTTSKSKSKTPKTVKPKSSKTKTDDGFKSKRRGTVKVEMRRRKREILPLDAPSPDSGLSLTWTTGSPYTTAAASMIEALSETTELYASESPAAAAAEHNIGFSPHVEHVHGESLLKPLVDESKGKATTIQPNMNLNKPNKEKVQMKAQGTMMNLNPNIFHATVSTQLIVGTEGEPDNDIGIDTDRDGKGTTAYDPDQMLVDLIDEQTMNLTAIELESSAAAAVSMIASNETSNSTNQNSIAMKVEMKGLSHNTVKLIESNDLSTSGSLEVDAELSQDQSQTNHSSSSSNSTISSLSFEDVTDGLSTNGNGSSGTTGISSSNDDYSASDAYSYNGSTTESLVAPQPAGDGNDTLTLTSQLIPSVSGTTNPTEIVVVTEGNKRALRNASHSHTQTMAQASDKPDTEEMSGTEKESKAMPTVGPGKETLTVTADISTSTSIFYQSSTSSSLNETIIMDEYNTNSTFIPTEGTRSIEHNSTMYKSMSILATTTTSSFIDSSNTNSTATDTVTVTDEQVGSSDSDFTTAATATISNTMTDEATTNVASVNV